MCDITARMAEGRGEGGRVTEAIAFTLMLMENWPRGLVFRLRATFMSTQPDIAPAS